MRITRGSRLRLRLGNLLFVALFLAAVGLVAWLSTRYHLQADWTASGRNTLSEASRDLLGRLSGPIHITAYAGNDEVLRTRIRDLVGRYQRHKADMDLRFVDPYTVPDEVRKLGIAVNGELVVSYQGRAEHVQVQAEEALTNALQRVARSGERWLVFVTGHGERKALGEANHDLGTWGKQLEKRGYKIQTLNLAQEGAIPDNTSVLVIAGPRVDYLPSEAALLRDYLHKGGNLLWLSDPGPDHGLRTLAEDLDVEFLPGVVVDPVTRAFGIDSPAVALVTGYRAHPVTRDFDLLTLFPVATALQVDAGDEWRAESLLSTGPQAWAETGELAGDVTYTEGEDTQGPLDIAVTLERDLDPEDGENPGTGHRVQRVLVAGDGDFLSNAFLGNGGNLDLGLNMVTWLASDDSLLSIPARTAPDLHLALSRTAMAVIGLGFLLVFPGLLLMAGVVVWLRRRRR